MLPPREDSPEALVCSSPPPLTITKEEQEVVTKSEEDQGGGCAKKDDVTNSPKPEDKLEEVRKEEEDLVKFEVDEKQVESEEELEDKKCSELKAVLLQELVEVHEKEKVSEKEEENEESNGGAFNTKTSTSITTSGGGGEGEVVEILSNLESLKTPEPHEVDDGIVRASFVDFVLEEEEDDCHGPIEEEDEDEEDDEEMGQMNGVLNPELQKIREEQVRKWLIFEEENPPGKPNHHLRSIQNGERDGDGEGEDQNTLSSLTSLDADSESLAEAQRRGEGGEGEGVEEGEMINGLEDGLQRRVRFLTDTEGNLLISVFMTNTATTPLSEEPSMISNGGGGGGGGDKNEVEGNPSLIVSPPSLTPEEEQGKKTEVEHKPSAPPQVDVDVEVEQDNEEDGEEEEEDDEDDEEPPSIVLVAPPPPVPTSAPPTQKEEDEGNSSDETLSVSSCNSMIEIMPAEQKKLPVLHLDLNNNEKEEQAVAKQVSPAPLSPQKEEEFGVGGAAPAPQANFHIEVEQQEQLVSQGEQESEEEEQPASLIIHELAEHNEGFATQNGLDSEITKLPNIDENNNVVSDSEIILKGESEEEQSQQFKFNPELESITRPESTPAPALSPIPMQMPELRRSSSDYGEDPERFTPPSAQSLSPFQRRSRNGSDTQGSEEDDDNSEQQMVSLCIQEEHISAVAVTIAKWESMSKAQSTENLSTLPAPQGTGGTGGHAPVAKTCSSPCPSKSVMKTVVTKLPSCPPSQQQQVQVQQVAIVQNNKENNKLANLNQNNTQNAQQLPPLPLNNPNTPVGIPSPILVGKAAGWNCWGNKIKELPEQNPQQQPKKEGGQGGQDDEIIYAQPNHQAGTTMTSIQNPSAILKAYPKPLSRGEIVNWLKEGEIHRAGINVSYGQSHHNHHHPPVVAVQGQNNNNILGPGVVNWFFGLISRQQAERYLHGQPPGTFLVRISTRIWGYTLSYQASTQRTKHFLISAINPAVPATLTAITDTAKPPPQTGKQQRMSPFVPQGRYAFIGTNMTPYGTLVSLIRHHSHAPITKLGGEKLLNSCPGGPQIQGLEQLFK
ncbi:unnamed protein product [Orchesella dallaii]|uniref:SH2 domain-containing protein n=1 Tax=Orchesella dallaii TaxID=48710 RepID=A0ABP1RMA0_9HEXA